MNTEIDNIIEKLKLDKQPSLKSFLLNYCESLTENHLNTRILDISNFIVEYNRQIYRNNKLYLRALITNGKIMPPTARLVEWMDNNINLLLPLKY